jgi:hypothetical protein
VQLRDCSTTALVDLEDDGIELSGSERDLE